MPIRSSEYCGPAGCPAANFLFVFRDRAFRMRGAFAPII
jgi:hypothetical protein